MVGFEEAEASDRRNSLPDDADHDEDLDENATLLAFERVETSEDETHAVNLPDSFDVSNNIEKAIANSKDIVLTQAMEEAVFDQLLNETADASVLTSAPLDFVEKFSTINIINNQSLARTDRQTKEALAKIQGNSRDKVTFFLISCKNTA